MKSILQTKWGELPIDQKHIIDDSTLVGDLDLEDVWEFNSGSEHLHFHKTGNTIDAYIIVQSDGNRNLLRGIRNITGKKGRVLNLVAFVTRRLNKKLTIDSVEKFSVEGFNWLKSLILKNGYRHNITDQTGKFPDIDSLEKEWDAARSGGPVGHTSIVIESNDSRVYEAKANNNRLMFMYSFIGCQDIL